MLTTQDTPTSTSRRRMRRSMAGLAALSVVIAACGSDDDAADSDPAPSATDTVTTATDAAPGDTVTEPVGTGAPDDESPDAEPAISEERCAANREAGTVTWVTAFDYAAAAGIAELIVADANGYFEELCIDVEIQSGFAPSNGALVIEGQAQMGMAGSFSELVANNTAGDGDLVALLHWGRTAIEEMVIPAGSEVATFADLCGTTVGIKGDLPYSLQAAVALSGIERSCFDEVLLDGFDPVQHLELGLDALPVYKSNEPAQLDAAGVEYTTLDPLDFDVPASFGIAFTTQSFIDEHPDTVQDIVRALVKGYEDAAADPQATVDAAFELINTAGNPNFLAVESELNRWTVESGLIAELAPDGVGVGTPDLELLGAEIDAMVEAGVFTEAPDWMSMVDTSIVESVYDGTTLIYPS
ncbi:MAG: ABC transporter substrate-binding protein [Ilumatobacter sp.]|uniref:ABC transporter substrate-binding protein n=2 Tax=Ilumatobacter sp. TaxID=1967498 RepID=UPI003297B9C4